MKFQLRRVLIIDDDESFSKALSRWLVQLACQPISATSAAQGIALLEQGSFDALLLDLELPDIHGHAIIRQLNSAGAPLPVIVISGTQEIDDIVRAWRENAADFLRKPFRAEELAAALDRAFLRKPPLNAAPEQPPNGPPTPIGASSAAGVAAAPATSLRSAQAHAANAEPARGAFAASPPTSTTGGLRPAVAKLAEDIRQGVVRLPILDPKVTQLPQFLSSDKWTIEELTDTLTRDANLAAAILRRANSTGFLRGKEITSLRDACGRLGSKTVVTIAFEITIGAQFAGTPEPFRSILKNAWRNAVTASRVAPVLGEMLGLKDRDELRLLSLFHNLGELMGLCLLSELDPPSTAKVDLEHLAAEVKTLHEDLGMALAASWKLPSAVVRMAGHHHRPFRQPESSDQLRTRSLVLASWSMALRAGFVYLPGHEAIDPAEFLDVLGLDSAQVEPVYERIKTWEL